MTKMWKTDYSVDVFTEYKPDAHAQRAIADALADAAAELAMNNECGEVRTTVSGDFYPYQTEAP